MKSHKTFKERAIHSLSEAQRHAYNLLLDGGVVIAGNGLQRRTFEILRQYKLAQYNPDSSARDQFVLADPDEPLEERKVPISVRMQPKVAKWVPQRVKDRYEPDKPVKFKRPPSVYSNRSQEQVINYYLKLQ